MAKDTKPPPMQLAGPDLVAGLERLSVPAFINDRKQVIRWANDAMRQRFGDRLEGRPFTAIVAPTSRRVTVEAFVKKMVGNVPSTQYQAVLIGRKGTPLPVEISSSRLGNGNHAIGVFGLALSADDEPIDPKTTDQLSPRQQQVLRLIARGYSTDQIAAELHLSKNTIRNHIRDTLARLGVHSRLEAVLAAQSRDPTTFPQALAEDGEREEPAGA